MKIKIFTNKCTGCMICQLWCSFMFHKRFSPSEAYIQVSTHELTPKIVFLDGCTQCGQCVDHCLYGALEIKEGED